VGNNTENSDSENSLESPDRKDQAWRDQRTRKKWSFLADDYDKQQYTDQLQIIRMENFPNRDSLGRNRFPQTRCIAREPLRLQSTGPALHSWGIRWTTLRQPTAVENRHQHCPKTANIAHTQHACMHAFALSGSPNAFSPYRLGSRTYCVQRA
jgi:hypothetical protein